MNMFEGSGEFENPRLLSDGLPSGRPTDYSLGSDALVMGQCKKLRGSNMHDPFVGTDSMEDGVWMSYANIVGTSLRRNTGDRDDLESLEFDLNKVVVLDEDCVVDRTGSFPKIEFSERVHKQIDSTMRNVVIESCVGKNGKDDDPKESSTNAAVEIATKEVPTEERGLFGPWMAVESRRKRSSMGGQSSSRRHGKQVSNSVDNRFTVLDNEQVEPLEDQRIESSINMANERVEHISEPVHGRSNAVFVEDNRDVSKNDAYRASNPESKAKESRQVFEKAVVMPMVEGQQVSVVKHNQTGGSKVHVAVSLFEKGYERVAWMGLCWGRRVGEGKAQKMAHSRINDIATHSELDPGGSTWVVVNQDGGLEPVVSMYIKQGIQTVVLDMVSSGEGRDSIADQ
ncbi:hypothetical protein V6N12_003117 [Hibiscus sabdariffa]|uniref:Uncharacterized protein n=1 Tax=Hibiscus sabdariffa TaxID=183260 RepID=A0ABR2EBE7_9ROSI